MPIRKVCFTRRRRRRRAVNPGTLARPVFRAPGADVRPRSLSAEHIILITDFLVVSVFQFSQRQEAQRTAKGIDGRRPADAHPVGTAHGGPRPAGGTHLAENPRLSGDRRRGRGGHEQRGRGHRGGRQQAAGRRDQQGRGVIRDDRQDQQLTG